jgi:hypothetical protein
MANSPQGIALIAENDGVGGGTAAIVRASDPNATLLQGINTANNGFVGVFRFDAQGNFDTNGNIHANGGSISAASFFGDGSGLTNISAASATSAQTAASAQYANNAGSLNGVPGINYARTDTNNTFNGDQNLNGNFAVTGTVSATKFAGDGSALTGLVVPPPHAYTYNAAGAVDVQLGSLTQVATLNLPGPATYLLSAKLIVNGAVPYFAECWLDNPDTPTDTTTALDLAQASLPAANNETVFNTLSLQATWQVSGSTAVVSLSCTDQQQAGSPLKIQISNVRLTALPIGGVN